MKASIFAILALLALAAHAGIVDKATVTLNFDSTPGQLPQINNSLIYLDKYQLFLENNTIVDIAAESSCDSNVLSYIYTNNNNVYCITDDKNYNQLLLQTNGTSQAKWVKNQTLSLSNGDYNPTEAIMTQDIGFIWSFEEEDLVVYNLTTQEFYTN